MMRFEKTVGRMAEEKERNDYSSISERKSRMGNGSLCTGHAAGKISERRFG